MKVNNDEWIEKKANKLRAEIKEYEKGEQEERYFIDTLYNEEIEDWKENVEVIKVNKEKAHEHYWAIKLLEQLLLGYYGIGIKYLEEDETEEEKLKEWLEDCECYFDDYCVLSEHSPSYYKNGIKDFYQEHNPLWDED